MDEQRSRGDYSSEPFNWRDDNCYRFDFPESAFALLTGDTLSEEDKKETVRGAVYTILQGMGWEQDKVRGVIEKFRKIDKESTNLGVRDAAPEFFSSNPAQDALDRWKEDFYGVKFTAKELKEMGSKPR